MSWCCLSGVPFVRSSLCFQNLERKCLFPSPEWGSFSSYLFKETFYTFISPPSGTHIMQMLFCLGLSHGSFSVLSFLEILFLCSSASLFFSSLISTSLTVCSTCSSLLFIPSIVFFISVAVIFNSEWLFFNSFYLFVDILTEIINSFSQVSDQLYNCYFEIFIKKTGDLHFI